MQDESIKITGIIITEVIPAVSELSNTTMSESAMQFWKISLEDLSVDQLRNGVKRIGREYKETWKMTPAQFREYCLTSPGESVEDEASQAWEEMLKRYTCTRSAYFKNHITAEVLREMGKQMFYDDPNNLKFWKKDFIKSYRVHKTRSGQYDPFILKEGCPNLRFIGEFNQDEKDRVKLEYSQKKASLLTGTILKTLGVKEQSQLNKKKIGGILNNLK